MYPQIIKDNVLNIIYFTDESKINKNELKEKEIEIIIDLNLYGEYIGIEIINLKYNLGKEIFSDISWKNKIINYSYDYDSDSFYLHLKDDRKSIDQKSIIAKALLTNKGGFIGLKWNDN